MAKKKDNRFNSFVSEFSFRAILLNPASMVLGVSIATIIGTIYLWNQHQKAIFDLEDYALTADKIVINDVPNWGTTDLKSLIVANNKEFADDEDVEATSLLDTGLVNRTASRLKNVGWIESVRSISKSKSGLKIDLQYRYPIGLVELNRSNVRQWPVNKAEMLIPVDRFGIVMPNEIASALPLIRFTVFEPIFAKGSEEWTAIEDERIQGCAEIAAYLSDHWQSMGFYRITSLRSPLQTGDTAIPFQIWTDTKPIATKIIWGNPPGKELLGEAPAKSKLEALQQIVSELGPLNELPPTTIDVRSGTPITSRDKTAASDSVNGVLLK